MKLTIHRGTHTIGGSCIEVAAGDCRIILDVGLPLMENDGSEIDEYRTKTPTIENGILPDVKGLYRWQTPGVSAVFVSHAHLDHHGLLKEIHPDIPVYVSQGTQALIEVGDIFFLPERKILRKTGYRIFDHWKPISVGPFTITPHLVDHSGFDAAAFLIAADNKQIFYSGDFRGHGHKKKLLDRMVKKPIKDLDCLLMEGTTLGGDHYGGFETEGDVLNEFTQIFSSQKDASLVMAAGSNIDRIVSLAAAAAKSKKTLVLDLYTLYALDHLRKLPFGQNLPPRPGSDIRVFPINGHVASLEQSLGENIMEQYKDRQIDIQEIVARRNEMVLKLPLPAHSQSGFWQVAKALAAEKPLTEAKYIFSMWQGYLEKQPQHNDFCTRYQIPLVKIHVSGHAYLKDLQRLAHALAPGKLVPVHTLSGDDFHKHFDNVARIDDSVPFEV